MSDEALLRIAAALERMSPPPAPEPSFTEATAYVWQPDPDRLEPVAEVNRVDLVQLIGIDRARDTLLANTLQFARGHAANNALLWGSRGMGKSSLVKAVHAEAVRQGLPLVLVEIAREDLGSVGRLLAILGRASERRFVLFGHLVPAASAIAAAIGVPGATAACILAGLMAVGGGVSLPVQVGQRLRVAEVASIAQRQIEHHRQVLAPLRRHLERRAQRKVRDPLTPVRFGLDHFPVAIVNIRCDRRRGERVRQFLVAERRQRVETPIHQRLNKLQSRLNLLWCP